MMGTTRRLGLAGGGIFRDLEGFLKIMVNVFKVSCLLVTEKLETVVLYRLNKTTAS